MENYEFFGRESTGPRVVRNWFLYCEWAKCHDGIYTLDLMFSFNFNEAACIASIRIKRKIMDPEVFIVQRLPDSGN